MLFTDDGKLYTWGWNRYGQLFIDKDIIVQDTPNLVTVEGDIKFNTIKCGGWSSFAFTDT